MDILFHIKKYNNYLNNSIQSLFSKKIKSLSYDDTLNMALNLSISISRFGDGEIRLINREDIEFQKSSILLSDRLKEVLTSNKKNHLVCIPNVFKSMSLYTINDKNFWRKHLTKYRKIWNKYLTTKKYYGDAFITRPYMNYKDKTRSDFYFNEFKKIWNNRDVLLVEGKLTRFGVSNSLLNNCKSLKRILCPPTDAFEWYQQIKQSVLKHYNNHLVLVSLGPTATILSYDLSLLGIQSIDIGHLDIEYEWFLLQTDQKVEIKGKYTNEAVYDKSTINSCEDPVYISQILSTIE